MSRMLKSIAAFFFALAAVTQVASALAEPCPPSSGPHVTQAQLRIIPNRAQGMFDIHLSGRASIPEDSTDGLNSAASFCSASIGELALEHSELCDGFNADQFSGEDRINRDKNEIAFDLFLQREYFGSSIAIDVPGGKSICADRLGVEIGAGAGGKFATIYGTPRHLDPSRATFDFTNKARAAPTRIFVTYMIDSRPATRASDKRFNGPRSWNADYGDRAAALLFSILLCCSVPALFWFLHLRSPLQPAPAWSAARPAVTAALALGLATSASVFVLNNLWNLASTMMDELPWLPGFGTGDANVQTLLGIVGVALLAVGGGLALVVRKKAAHMSLWSLPSIFAQAGIFMLIAASLVLACLALDHSDWLGFEGPAILISFIYVAFAAGRGRKLFALPVWAVVGIALLLALTLFFPTDPVVRSAQVPSVSKNTAYWTIFIGSGVANWAYIAALAGLSFLIARDYDTSDRATVEWIAYLLLLEIGGFAISIPTNAVALALILLISRTWLFTPQSAGQASLDPGDQVPDAFPWLVGGVAALISLVQFAFSAGGNSFTDDPGRFPLLQLTTVVLRPFAFGVTAGLLLSFGYRRLRGDSAALKAVSISGLILAANIATGLAYLSGRQTLSSHAGGRVFTGLFSEHLGLFAALILCAVFYFDLPRARAGGGEGETGSWRNLFKGTTLAGAIPILTAIAAAALSALSPIISDAVGASLKPAVQSLLPTVAAKSDAAAPAAPAK